MGLSVGTATGEKRRTVDSEINMIPMIDLLMVTISFLLITAVWTHMARVNANASVPGRPPVDTPTNVDAEKQLHVEMRAPEKFALVWRQGGVAIDSIDVPRSEPSTSSEGVRFPELADRIGREWRSKGQHSSPGDRALDQAIVHTGNGTEFKELVGVIDAIYQTHRDVMFGAKTSRVPAFNVVFAMD